MIRDLAAWLRSRAARPSPARILLAVVAIGLVLIPAARPFGNVRALALAGIAVAVAGIVLDLDGLPTTVCGLGIAETAIVVVHEGGFPTPVLEAVVLLLYLAAIDVVGHGRAETRVDARRLLGEAAAVVAGGLALLVVIAALSVVGAGASFAVAVLAIIAAAVAVAALRWLVSG